MKQLLLFFLVLAGYSALAQAPGPDPTLRLHMNMRRDGQFGLLSKQDSLRFAAAAAGATVDTTALATKAQFNTLTTKTTSLSTSLSAKLNYSDTTLFVRKLAGTRLLTTAEGTKLAGLPSSAVDATTYSTNRTADLSAATNPANLVQSATYRFTSDVEKAAWTAKLGASDLKTINGIPVVGVGDIVITGGTGAVTTNATSLTAGILDDARLSGNIVKTSGTYSNPGFITALDAAKITETTTKRFTTDTEKTTWNGYGTSKLNYSDSTLFVRKLANTRLITNTEVAKLAGLPSSAVDATTYATNRTADQAAVTTASTNASAALTSASSATAAVAGKASLSGANFTGSVTAPTPTTNTATNDVATTLYTKNELIRWFRDSLTTYGPGFDSAQFVAVGTGSDSFIRIKPGILGSGGGGSGTVDQSLSASSTNAVSNAVVTTVLNSATAAITANSATINTLVGATLTPTVTNLTASNVSSSGLTLSWGSAQASAAPVVQYVDDVTALLAAATGATRKIIICQSDPTYSSTGPTVNIWDGTNLQVIPSVKRN